MGSTHPLASLLLASAQPSLTPWGPGSLTFPPKLQSLPAAAHLDLHRGVESSPPSSPKPWTEKLRSLLHAGCLHTGCLSQPLSHIHSHSLSRWETMAKPFPYLTPSSWHPTHPAMEWGSEPPSRVMLTFGGGKSTMSLFLPSLSWLQLAYAISHETTEMHHMSWDLWGLCITPENDLKTVRRMTSLGQNPKNEQNGVLVAGMWCRKS